MFKQKAFSKFKLVQKFKKMNLQQKIALKLEPKA